MKVIQLKFFRIISMLLPILFITACMGTMGAKYRPIVDPKGTDMALFEVDLVECQTIAKEQSVANEAGKGAVLGAAAGTLVGVVTGAIFGNAGQGAALGAGYGGTSGAVQGASSGIGGQESIVKRCMIGRGYRVLK